MYRKFIYVIMWATVVLAVMCTSDAQAFLFNQELHYTFNWTPRFSEMLMLSDVGLTDSFYLIQKAGHIISFGILYMLVFNWLKKPNKAFVLCVAFALFSEVLQLFFQRNGRLFDIGVDLIGIFLAYTICVSIQKHKKAAME
ncbi:VanZ family protein [Planococcus shixiaomingii]|uniref:VanZ family protein n=1 Tax=Planococcus shixiaomingii TaxID=3058393 RepID=UPI00262096AA|nr:VanZ family protein [Planococcus sp. N022]WKA53876.1 VanZ family protein [Planococcus sp. N022]